MAHHSWGFYKNCTEILLNVFLDAFSSGGHGKDGDHGKGTKTNWGSEKNVPGSQILPQQRSSQRVAGFCHQVSKSCCSKSHRTSRNNDLNSFQLKSILNVSCPPGVLVARCPGTDLCALAARMRWQMRPSHIKSLTDPVSTNSTSTGKETLVLIVLNYFFPFSHVECTSLIPVRSTVHFWMHSTGSLCCLIVLRSPFTLPQGPQSILSEPSLSHLKATLFFIMFDTLPSFCFYVHFYWSLTHREYRRGEINSLNQGAITAGDLLPTFLINHRQHSRQPLIYRQPVSKRAPSKHILIQFAQ